jgi:hypothetical protein
MNATQTETRYYIFKCRNHECNETIPVISFISQYAFSAGSIYLKRQDAERDYDLITVDVICPFCCAANNVQIKENKKELSRKDYNEASKSMKVKLALRHTYDKVFTQDYKGQPGAVSSIP